MPCCGHDILLSIHLSQPDSSNSHALFAKLSSAKTSYENERTEARQDQHQTRAQSARTSSSFTELIFSSCHFNDLFTPLEPSERALCKQQEVTSAEQEGQPKGRRKCAIARQLPATADQLGEDTDRSETTTQHSNKIGSLTTSKPGYSAVAQCSE